MNALQTASLGFVKVTLVDKKSLPWEAFLLKSPSPKKLIIHVFLIDLHLETNGLQRLFICDHPPQCLEWLSHCNKMVNEMSFALSSRYVILPIVINNYIILRVWDYA